MSVSNTTVCLIYNKISILSGRHVSTFNRSSSGPLENRSKNHLYFNALCDPKCLHLMFQKCKIGVCTSIYQSLCNILSVENVKNTWDGDVLKVETYRHDSIPIFIYIKQIVVLLTDTFIFVCCNTLGWNTLKIYIYTYIFRRS